ncbi:hypothetical protein OG349_04015 [Streptomyces sp. NBC_01317]|uniref:hypothetical protein n=1 Tax=Streptomyces sp. NBC_01317 TaxID=2903822 RepID=UPI002E15E798|nr:hypothetical protein OG349_04015 [Streptomyces sp. NBC_01317]
MSRAVKSAVAAASGLLITLGAASSAQAYPYETFIGYAGSSSYGYGAYVGYTDGDPAIIYADDTSADGYRIVTRVYNNTQGTLVGYAEDANGGNNGPGASDYDYSGHAGDSMSIQTCRQNGAAGTPVNCRTTSFKLPW